MLEELTSLGLDSTKIGAYCREKCFLSLTGSTIAFTRAVLNHVDSVMKVSDRCAVCSVDNGTQELAPVESLLDSVWCWKRGWDLVLY